MGSIRCPRPIYNDKIVVDFKVRNKEVHYIIYKWNDDGTVRSDVDSGKLGDQSPQQIMDNALRIFSTVSRK